MTRCVRADLRRAPAGAESLVISAFFDLAAARSRLSVSDLERADIAVAELLDAVEPVEVVEFVAGPVGYEIRVPTFERSLADMDPGTRAILDAGFDDWSVEDTVVTIRVGGPVT